MHVLPRARFQVILLAASWGAALTAAPAQAADYYAGKTIEFVVGSDAGGGYDIYARTVARHMGRHIPGNPTTIVRNMPGAIIGPLLDDKPNLNFDPTKVIYIGTADSGVRVCTTFRNSKIKTFEDAQKTKTIVGGSAAGGATRDYPYLHNHTAGSKFEVVSGYTGTPDISLAMERGEVDGICGWDWSSVKSQKGDWLRDKKLNVLVQVSLEPEAELTKLGVPSIWKYVSEENRQVAELVISQQVFQRSYIAPPGTPDEEIAILRKAFDETMGDPQFLADAEKVKISIAPLQGAKVQSLIGKLYATPKEVVDRAKAVIKP
jgi:hypothetical protein